MDLKQALMQTELQLGFSKGSGCRAYLALRREGINTLQQLHTYSPDQLAAVRDIGTRCLELIAACLQLYDVQGPSPPGGNPEHPES